MKKNNTDQNINQNNGNQWLMKAKEIGEKILKKGLQHK